MALTIVILFAISIMRCDGQFKEDSFHKELTLADQMCPHDQVDFQTVTKSAVSCVRKCSEEPGCRSLVYLPSNTTCFGIKTDNPFGASTPLLGASFYTTTTTTPTPMPTPTTTATTSQPTTLQPGVDCSSFTAANVSGSSDIYQLWMPQQNVNRHVVCDGITDGGGWLVIQRRFDGSVNFYRNFSEYEEGFGDLSGEFWMGIRDVQELISCGTNTWEVRFDLEDAQGNTSYQTYQEFRLAPPPHYTLHIGETNGTANRVYSESQGFTYNNNTDFSTYDFGPAPSCGSSDQSGWWFRTCTYVNLNGLYMHPPGNITLFETAITYRSFDYVRSLKSTEMKIRRVSGSGC